jgi:hypothetical protein
MLDGPGGGIFVNLTSNLTMTVVLVLFAVFFAFSFQRMAGNSLPVPVDFIWFPGFVILVYFSEKLTPFICT